MQTFTASGKSPILYIVIPAAVAASRSQPGHSGIYFLQQYL